MPQDGRKQPRNGSETSLDLLKLVMSADMALNLKRHHGKLSQNQKTPCLLDNKMGLILAQYAEPLTWILLAAWLESLRGQCLQDLMQSLLAALWLSSIKRLLSDITSYGRGPTCKDTGLNLVRTLAGWQRNIFHDSLLP